MKIKQQVEAILKHAPMTRDSDKELFIIFMQKSGLGLSDEQIRTFKSMPSLETVRRLRQKIQEEGKYPASPSVDKARFHKFVEIRHGGDPEKVLEDKGYKVLPWGH